MRETPNQNARVPIMGDQDALIAFQLGKRLDQETTHRLWASGYIEVANPDPRPNGTGELKGRWITPKGSSNFRMRCFFLPEPCPQLTCWLLIRF